MIVVEGSSGLEGEPGLIVAAMGGGAVQGSGVVQDGLDLEVSVDAMLVWAEHRTGATWCTGFSSGGTRSG